jgi:hypothetical protein
MTDRPVAVRKNPSTIAQIISALDDRNLGRAMRLLEPASESAEPHSEQQVAAQCVRCATRGE